MGFFKDASDLQDRVNRSPIAIALILLVIGSFACVTYWRDKPYRDAAESLIRRDQRIAETVGEIRRINHKSTSQGGCAFQCPTHRFSVVGTRAIAHVSIEFASTPGERIRVQSVKIEK
jgi:hypothetical protein